MHYVQPRFEKTCENICVCEKHLRNNTLQCHRRCQLSRQLRHSPRSCHARRDNRARYPARQQTKPTRYTARLTYQAHALFSAATANPTADALYSTANVPSSRAIQRGDSKTNRAIQRGERTRLTRCSARRRQSQTRYTAWRKHQAHALSSAATAKPNALYSAANAPGTPAIQRGDFHPKTTTLMTNCRSFSPTFSTFQPTPVALNFHFSATAFPRLHFHNPGVASCSSASCARDQAP